MKNKKLIYLLLLVLIVAGFYWFKEFNKKEPIYSTNNAEALKHYHAGVNLVLMYYVRDAGKEFDKAIKLDPDFPLPYIYKIMLSMNGTGKGVTEYYKKIAVPKKKWTQFEKDIVGIFMEYTKKREHIKGDKKFAEKIKKLINKYSNQIEIYPILLPMYRGAIGNTDKLIEYYEYLHNKFPNNTQIINELGYMYMKKRNYKKAENYFKKYIFVEPEKANPYDSIADLYYTSGNLKKAKQYYEKALKIKPDFLDSNIKRALCYISLGQTKKAVSIMDKLEKTENSPFLHNVTFLLKTLAYTNTKNIEKLKELAESPEQNCYTAVAKGFLYYLQKDTTKLAQLINSYKNKCKNRLTKESLYFLETALFLQQNKEKEAIKRIENFKSHDYSAIVIFRLLAVNYYISKKQFADAERQCKGLNEGDSAYIKMLIAKAKGDKEKCKEFAKKVIEYYNESDENFYKKKEAEQCLK